MHPSKKNSYCSDLYAADELPIVFSALAPVDSYQSDPCYVPAPPLFSNQDANKPSTNTVEKLLDSLQPSGQALNHPSESQGEKRQPQLSLTSYDDDYSLNSSPVCNFVSSLTRTAVAPDISNQQPLASTSSPDFTTPYSPTIFPSTYQPDQTFSHDVGPPSVSSSDLIVASHSQYDDETDFHSNNQNQTQNHSLNNQNQTQNPSLNNQNQTQNPSLNNLNNNSMVVPRIGVHQDWNGELIKAKGQVDANAFHRTSRAYVEGLERLVEISHDFTTFASKYGEIIVSELPLPNAMRTIPALQGHSGEWGNAGGAKYIYHGIFFKFALDWKGIYGSDEAAAKAASAELRALTELQLVDLEMKSFRSLGPCQRGQRDRPLPNIATIHFPLMVLIDHHGYRLIAMSILPIEHGRPPNYGSDSAGATVFNDIPLLSDTLDVYAQTLNLKDHLVGPPRDPVQLAFPVDIEGRQGTDGRFYLLDLARVFPPEYPLPGSPGSAVFSRFLRPEHVRTNPVPLSSDALTRFGWHDKLVHNKEVLDATIRLFQEKLPSFAAELDDGTVEAVGRLMTLYMSPKDLLIHALHRKGINIRHLGILWKLLKSPFWKMHVMEEIVARAFKSILRRGWREASQRLAKCLDTSRVLQDFAYMKVALQISRDIMAPMKQKIELWLEHLVPQIKRQFVGFDPLGSVQAATPSTVPGATLTISPTSISTTPAANTSDPPPSTPSDPPNDSSYEQMVVLVSSLDIASIFLRFVHLAGIRLTDSVQRILAEDTPDAFCLTTADIVSLTPMIKQTNLTYCNQAHLFEMLMRRETDPNAKDRYFLLIIAKYQAALQTTPCNRGTLLSLARLLIARAHEHMQPATFAKRSRLIIRFLRIATHLYSDAGGTMAGGELIAAVMSALEQAWPTAPVSLQIQFFHSLLAALDAGMQAIGPEALDDKTEFRSVWLCRGAIHRYLSLLRQDSDGHHQQQAIADFRRALCCKATAHHLTPHYSLKIRRWAAATPDAAFCDVIFALFALKRAGSTKRIIDAGLFFGVAGQPTPVNSILSQHCYDESLLAWSALWCTSSRSAAPKLAVLKLKNQCLLQPATLSTLIDRHGAHLRKLDLGFTEDLFGKADPFSASSALPTQGCLGYALTCRRTLAALLPQCLNLEALSFRHNLAVDDDLVAHLIRVCPKLAVVDLYGCHALGTPTPGGPPTLSEAPSSQLRSFKLSLNGSASMHPLLLRWMAASPKLQDLVLRDCAIEPTLVQLIKRQAFHRLDIPFCFTSDSVPPLPLHLSSSLSSVDFSHAAVTDSMLAQLAASAYGLRELRLNSCAHISGRGLFPLLKNCHLQVLELDHVADGINDSLCQAIANSPTAHSLLFFSARSGNFFRDGMSILLDHCLALQQLCLSHSPSLSLNNPPSHRTPTPLRRDLTPSFTPSLTPSLTPSFTPSLTPPRRLNDSEGAAAGVFAETTPTLSSSCPPPPPPPPPPILGSAVAGTPPNHGLPMGRVSLPPASPSRSIMTSLETIARASTGPVKSQTHRKPRQFPLKSLQLSSCNKLTTSQMIQFFKSCKSLEILIIDQCHWVNHEIAQVLAVSCKRLKFVSALGAEKFLESLNLTGGRHFSASLCFENLTSLRATNPSISKIFTLLAKLPCLESLALTGSGHDQLTTDLNTLNFERSPTRINRLKLANYRISPRFFAHILSALPCLISLSIRNLPGLLDHDMTFTAIASCPHLSFLSLASSCTPTALPILSGLPQLRYLRLRDFVTLSIEGPISFPRLLSLDCRFAAASIDDALVELITACPRLQFIHLPPHSRIDALPPITPDAMIVNSEPLFESHSIAHQGSIATGLGSFLLTSDGSLYSPSNL